MINGLLESTKTTPGEATESLEYLDDPFAHETSREECGVPGPELTTASSALPNAIPLTTTVTAG